MRAELEVVRLDTDLAALIPLHVEYMSWIVSEVERTLGIALVDQNPASIEAYVASGLDKICGHGAPQGRFYVVRVDGHVAGMGGLRPLEAGVGELKRIYVRPAYRRLGLGSMLVERLLDDARTLGYRSVRLDSAPFQRPAQRLYEALGFRDRTPYAGTEVPASLHGAWRFMEASLPTQGMPGD